jgi:hypothetical protein
MKLVTVVFVLAVLSTLDLVISKKAKLKRKRKTHRDMMQELAAYGEEQLKEFKKRNPIREGWLLLQYFFSFQNCCTFESKKKFLRIYYSSKNYETMFAFGSVDHQKVHDIFHLKVHINHKKIKRKEWIHVTTYN